MTTVVFIVGLLVAFLAVVLILLNLNPPDPMQEMPDLIERTKQTVQGTKSSHNDREPDQSTEDESDQAEQTDDDWVPIEVSIAEQLEKKYESWGRSAIRQPRLGFDPIHTFEPDPAQWQDPAAAPWPRRDEAAQSDYQQVSASDAALRDWERAVEWLKEASTSAIHQSDELRRFMRSMLGFMVRPNASGAELTEECGWREENRNFSRLIGERLLVMAFGISCHGAHPMPDHKRALQALMERDWVDDSLEKPLFEQCLARLRLLSHTDLKELAGDLRTLVQQELNKDTDELDRLEIARRNTHLLLMSAGSNYPFPRDEDGQSRLWHPDATDSTMVDWSTLLPVLHTLWVFYWLNPDPELQEQELLEMLDAWWERRDINPEDDDFVDVFPEYWEGILMTAWALSPDSGRVWDRIQRRWDELPEVFHEHDNLKRMTDTYRQWHSTLSDKTGDPPPASFTGKRMPPTAWIQPLPSDLIRDLSEPSFDYPREWCEEMSRFEHPDQDRIKGAIPG